MEKMKKIFIIFLLTVLTFPILTLDSPSVNATPDEQSTGIIRVGSKAFTENRVLGNIVYHVLTDMGFRVFFQTDDAPTAELRELLATGEIDVYVEYTGTGILFLNGQFPDQVPFDAGFNPVLAYQTVLSFDSINNDLQWLPPAPANNTYALAVTEAFSEENDIETVSEFVEYVNAGNPVVLAGGSEFLVRDDGMRLFYDTYNFQLLDNQIISIEDGQPQDTLPYLAEGRDGTNIAMAYGTTGELLIGEFVLLEDDLFSQFVYQPAPVFRGEVIRNNPAILQRLQPVFQALTNRTLQDLNLAVAEFGDSPSEAALRFLIENDFIEPDEEGGVVITAPECEVERPIGASVSANLRSLPSLDGDIVGSIAGGVSLPVQGKALDDEGFTWWQVTLTGNPWVRGDTVQPIGNCNAVPDAG